MDKIRPKATYCFREAGRSGPFEILSFIYVNYDEVTTQLASLFVCFLSSRSMSCYEFGKCSIWVSLEEKELTFETYLKLHFKLKSDMFFPLIVGYLVLTFSMSHSLSHVFSNQLVKYIYSFLDQSVPIQF